jgi:hypothetical protein
MNETLRAVRGSLRYVRLLAEPPSFIRREKLFGARAEGVRYEKKVREKLRRLVAERPELDLALAQWIEFQDDEGRKWAEVDAFVQNRQSRNAICFEVKLRHTPSAWFQLWKLYVPLLQHALSGFRWEGVEVVKWFDPSTGFPEPFSLTPSPFVVPVRGRTAVFIYNPSRD